MASYNYVWIDGERVEVHVAVAFGLLKGDFERAHPGLTLKIKSGTRTRAEQAALYYGWTHRLPGYNLAARPGYSNHEEDGPIGPRALDLYDTGSDPGVTVIGTARSNWLVKAAAKRGFRNAGHYFNPREGWHYEYTRKIGGKLPSSSGSKTSSTKEVRVKAYHKQDATARKSGRTLKPGNHFYLHLKKGMPTSNASNVVGNPGTYSITTHVYASGTPGDVVCVHLIWQNTLAKHPKNSGHYWERITIDKDGFAKASREFKRGVSRGYAVYAQLSTPKTNKGNVKVNLFDTDAYLFIGA